MDITITIKNVPELNWERFVAANKADQVKKIGSATEIPTDMVFEFEKLHPEAFGNIICSATAQICASYQSKVVKGN